MGEIKLRGSAARQFMASLMVESSGEKALENTAGPMKKAVQDRLGEMDTMKIDYHVRKTPGDETYQLASGRMRLDTLRRIDEGQGRITLNCIDVNTHEAVQLTFDSQGNLVKKAGQESAAELALKKADYHVKKTPSEEIYRVASGHLCLDTLRRIHTGTRGVVLNCEDVDTHETVLLTLNEHGQLVKAG